MKNNAKGRVIWTYRLMERETLQEIWRKTKKKIVVEPCRVGEREKVLKSFEKVGLNKSNLIFLKLDSRVSIDQKSISINRNRQRLVKNFKTISKQFRLIEKQIGSIKIDRGFLKQYYNNFD